MRKNIGSNIRFSFPKYYFLFEQYLHLFSTPPTRKPEGDIRAFPNSNPIFKILGQTIKTQTCAQLTGNPSSFNGEFVRQGSTNGGSESEHGMVHVPWRLDDLYIHPLLLLDDRPLRLRLFSWHGLDDRQSCPFRCNWFPPFLLFKTLVLIFCGLVVVLCYHLFWVWFWILVLGF